MALAVAGIALDDGSYAVTTRNAIAIAVWGALALAVLAGIWPRERLPLTAKAAVCALLGLALLSLVSIAWSDSAERAFDEFTRMLLYLGILAFVICVAPRGSASRWTDGLAVGIAAIALLALVTRLFPSFISAAEPAAAFEGDVRPTYPLGYWNAVAVFAALGLPLLLRAGLAWTRTWARGLAIGAVPPLIALIYLTSSRTGVVTAVVAVLSFLALTGSRGRAASAAGVAAVGGAGAIAVLAANSAILDGPLDSSTAHSQGRVSALLILAISIVVGVGHVLSSRTRLTVPRPSPRARKVAIAGTALLLLAAVVAADPAERFESFKEPPPPRGEGVDGSYITTHITSGGSSGRWQFWSAAVDQWREHPLAGDGAGSYAAWWAEHGSLSYVTRDGHSVYVELLGELGLVGLLLMLGLLAAVGSAIRGRVRQPHSDRATIAALGSVAAAFALASGIDWMWELPGVAAVGVLAFALLVGPATDLTAPAQHQRHRGGRRLARGAVAAAALAAIVAQGIPLLAQRALRDSEEQLENGELTAALDSARDAEDWQPWAASPHLQIAVVHGKAGRFPDALEAIDDAIERDPADWQLRLVASRLEGASGDERAAADEFEEALRLNPMSPLLKSLERRQ